MTGQIATPESVAEAMGVNPATLEKIQSRDIETVPETPPVETTGETIEEAPVAGTPPEIAEKPEEDGILLPEDPEELKRFALDKAKKADNLQKVLDRQGHEIGETRKEMQKIREEFAKKQTEQETPEPSYQDVVRVNEQEIIKLSKEGKVAEALELKIALDRYREENGFKNFRKELISEFQLQQDESVFVMKEGQRVNEVLQAYPKENRDQIAQIMGGMISQNPAVRSIPSYLEWLSVISAGQLGIEPNFKIPTNTPTVVPSTPPFDAGGKSPSKSASKALTSDQIRIADAMGVSHAKYIKYMNEGSK